MSGIGAKPLTRVKGRPALIRSLRALLIRVHRFGRARAVSQPDRRWAAALIDALTAAVAEAEREGQP
jgi:hypothetical protein